MAKQTAAERRAREAAEVVEITIKWQAEKPMRVLQALARAQDLGMETHLCVKQDDLFIRIHDSSSDTCHDVYLSELSIWQMQAIEQGLTDLEAERARAAHLQEVRAQVLARLSAEEREALGV